MPSEIYILLILNGFFIGINILYNSSVRPMDPCTIKILVENFTQIPSENIHKGSHGNFMKKLYENL
jgi:hypothetical protein